MKIIVGSDHAGYNHKVALLSVIKKMGLDYMDCGCYDDSSVDYPDYAHVVSKAVVKDKKSIGVLICGSANGVAMAANKHVGIRAAICWNKSISKLSRTHNDSNILCVPARFISTPQLEEIFKVFISSEFHGGRHEKRVKKIDCN